MPALSKSLDRFPSSKIASIFALATRLQEEGRDIVNLSTGEPDFDTDISVREAAKKAIDEGATRYTALDGTSALKRAVQAKFSEDNGLDFELDEIIIDTGAKPLLAHIMLALLDPDDEVIIPTPCWTSHPGAVRFCGVHPVFARTREEDDFKLKGQGFRGLISPKTKLLILNSPSNPTGAVYSEDELRELTEVLLAYPDIWIIADDIYEKLLFDGRTFATPAAIEPRLRDRVITVNGVSKSYAMTGWRIGYAGGPREAMAGVRKVMSQTAGSPPAMSQAAAVAALTGPQDYVAEQVATYQSRRDLVVRALNQALGLKVAPSQGAFYLFVNCAGVLGKETPGGKTIQNSTDFVSYLLEDHGIALVPGAAFEADPYFRLSFAASNEALEQGCKRIIAGCSSLN